MGRVGWGKPEFPKKQESEQRKSSCGNRKGPTLVTDSSVVEIIWNIHVGLLPKSIVLPLHRPVYLGNSSSTTQPFLPPVFGLRVWLSSGQCEMSKTLGASSSLESIPCSSKIDILDRNIIFPIAECILTARREAAKLGQTWKTGWQSRWKKEPRSLMTSSSHWINQPWNCPT